MRDSLRTTARLLLGLLGALLLSNGGCKEKDGGKGGEKQENVALEDGGTLTLPLSIAPDAPELARLDFSEPALFALGRAIELPLLVAKADGTTLPGAVSECIAAAGDSSSYTLKFRAAPGHEQEPDYLGKLCLRHWEKLLRGADGPLKSQLADLLAGGEDFSEGRGDSVSGLSLSGDTLSVKLSRPVARFGLWLSQPGLGILEGAALPAEGGSPAGGYGPFMATAFSGADITLTPNPASMLGTPKVDKLVFHCEPDRVKQVELFRNGQLDSANVAILSAQDVDADSLLAPYVHRNPTASQLVGVFNLKDKHFPWADQGFQKKLGLRQALNWGLDRAGMAEDLGGQIAAWPHLLPQSMQDSVEPALVSSPTYPEHPEIEKARQGEREADHDQGSNLLPGLDLAYLNDADLRAPAEELLRYWNEVSIKMRPLPMTRAELEQRLQLGSLEIYLQRCTPAWPSEEAYLYGMLYSTLQGEGGNRSLYVNPELDQLIARAQAETQPDALRELYQQIEAQVESDSLFVFVGTCTPSILIAPRVGGVKLNPYDFDASLSGQDFTAIGVRAGAGGSSFPQTASTGP